MQKGLKIRLLVQYLKDLMMKKAMCIALSCFLLGNVSQAMLPQPMSVAIAEKELQRCAYELHDACLVGNITKIQALCRFEYSRFFVNRVNELGETPLYILANIGAHINNQTAYAISLLIEIGADIKVVKYIKDGSGSAIGVISLRDALVEGKQLIPYTDSYALSLYNDLLVRFAAQ